jgi:hypothetical protein
VGEKGKGSSLALGGVGEISNETRKWDFFGGGMH